MIHDYFIYLFVQRPDGYSINDSISCLTNLYYNFDRASISTIARAPFISRYEKPEDDLKCKFPITMALDLLKTHLTRYQQIISATSFYSPI